MIREYAIVDSLAGHRAVPIKVKINKLVVYKLCTLLTPGLPLPRALGARSAAQPLATAFGTLSKLP